MCERWQLAHDVFFGNGTSQETSILWTLPRLWDTMADASESTVWNRKFSPTSHGGGVRSARYCATSSCASATVVATGFSDSAGFPASTARSANCRHTHMHMLVVRIAMVPPQSLHA